MDKATFEKYLKDRYYDQMNYYDRKSGFNQKRYRNFQWLLIVLSAITPVIAALQGSAIFGTDGVMKSFGDNLQVVVIITSGIVAVLTAALKTFQYQELWVSYRLTQELLKPELYYYQFGIGPYAEAGVDKESLFVSRVESILDKEHSGWPPSKKSGDNTNGGEQTNTETGATTIENQSQNPKQ